MLGKQKAKYIQSLGHKKYRDEEGLFIAEGPRLVEELLSSAPQYIKEIFAVKEWLKDHDGLHKPGITEVTESELGKISQLKTPHQVLAIVRKFKEEDQIIVKGKISLVLDGIQDPGNMGTIVRIADWFGVGQVICSNDCADIYNPRVVQATMGSIARVKLLYTDLVSWLSRQKGIRVYAAMLEGKDITKMSPLSEGLIVIGNEAKGIREEIIPLVNERITIPKKGEAESLNAAVAAGIVLSRLAG